MTLHITLFYSPQIFQNKTRIKLRGRKPLALLTYLLLTGKAHTRQHLVDLLFSEAADPRGGLRWALSQLRRTVGRHYIQTTGQQLSFNFDSDYDCDVADFLNGQTNRYQGDLLEGVYVRDALGFMDWLLFEREHLRDVYQSQLIEQLASHKNAANHAETVNIAHRLVQTDNLREEWYRELIRAYAVLGKRNAALIQFDRCQQVLQKELGLDPSAETEALITAVKENRSLPINKPVVVENRLHLPVQLTTFVGREQEVTAVIKRLENPNCRFLTLVGAGGMGKTRLAIQTASKIRPAFEHGIFFVPLETVSSATELATAIAKTLSIPRNAEDDLETQLLNYVRNKTMLLLLDNVEHLLNQPNWAMGERLLLKLLMFAPNLKLLLTSRQRLHLQAEWIFDVDGLSFPQDEGVVDNLLSYTAVQLFLQRAQQIHPEFAPDSISPENLACVVDLCRLLNGVPLAIELAAAGIRQRPCSEISRAIIENLDFLTSSLHDVPERHASMRAVFNHSWALLADNEKQLLTQLSIFHGGFDLVAAKEILTISLFDLSLLVDKSLLQRGSANRYHMHMLIKQFVSEKQRLHPQLDEAAREAHSQYYCHFADRKISALRNDWQRSVSQSIETDLRNISSGWEWAIDHGNFAQVAQTAFGLGYYYEINGRYQEGLSAFTRASEKLKLAPSSGQQAVALARVLHWNGRFLPYLSEAAPIWSQIEPLLAIAKSAGLNTQVDTARLLLAQGQANEEQENFELAQQLFQQSLIIYQELGDKHGQADVWDEISELKHFQGHLKEAELAAQESLVLREAISDRVGMINTLGRLSQVLVLLRKYDEGIHLAEKCVQLCQSLHNPKQMADSLQIVDWALLIAGQVEESLHYVEERLPLCIDLGLEPQVNAALLSLAWRNSLLGNTHKAQTFAHQLRKSVSDTPDNLNGSKCGLYYTLSQLAFMDGAYEDAYDQAVKASHCLQAAHQQSVVLMNLGMAELALGKVMQAEKRAYQGLQLRGTYALVILHLVAILLGRRAKTMAEKELPYTLISLQRHHLPVTNTAYFHQSVQRLWPKPLSTLSAERIAAAEAYGRSCSPTEVIEQLLDEYMQ